MPGLIQKSGYIKPGNGGGHYAEYIATREGVELIEAPHPSHDGGGYLEYMAQRPRSHGLFSADGPADLEKTMEEINGHTGPVWTFVYSLKREDAHRLGYETSESWRKLLLAHQTELAQAMKISPSRFRWRAAFHDEKHHPHIHMMVWSADPKQGYLTEKGIEKMRSQLSNEIFRDELLSLYQQKDLSYSQVRDAAMEAMGRLIREMETGLCHSPIIMEQVEKLAEMLENHKGKKVYGYLKKPAKAQVDAIVDELAKDQRVAAAYNLWNQMREEVCRTYSEQLPERLPLSKQKEFKAVRNMVIREMLRLGRCEPPTTDEVVHGFTPSSTPPAQSGMPHGVHHPQQKVTHHQRTQTHRAVSHADTARCVLQLFHNMGRIFREQSASDAIQACLHIDRKRRRMLREKRMALGHKADDHEEIPQHSQR